MSRRVDVEGFDVATPQMDCANEFDPSEPGAAERARNNLLDAAKKAGLTNVRIANYLDVLNNRWVMYAVGDTP